MNQTQKNCIKFWTKLLLIVASAIALFVGMCVGSTVAHAIVAIFAITFFAYVIILWTAERIYLWRIMGILTPEEYKVVKWYKYSLLSNGVDHVIDCLIAEDKPSEWYISIFKKIKENVKRPKIIS